MWETLITNVCNASIVVMKYSVITSTILTKATQRKSFAKDSTYEAYVVQGLADRPNNQGKSSSRQPTNQRSQSKFRENQICNYCKKLGHIKANCRTVKARNEKAQRADHKGGKQEEVNYIDASAEVLTNDPNIVSIENPVEPEVLLMTEE